MQEEKRHVPPAIYEFIFDCQDAKLPEQEIVKQLERKGMAREQVTMLVRQMTEERSQALRFAGKRNCIYGGMWALGSLGALAMLYSMAAEGSARAYAAVGCSMLFGLMLLVRGLLQMRSS